MPADALGKSGVYIVEPLNVRPVSVNANDPRMAARCLHVVRGYIKVGKAKNLERRARAYQKVFGPEAVRFRALALLMETRVAERCLLDALERYRQRAPSGRRTEWLLGITASDAAVLAREQLLVAGVSFEWVWNGESTPA